LLLPTIRSESRIELIAAFCPRHGRGRACDRFIVISPSPASEIGHLLCKVRHDYQEERT
jgi:hypothetical protein